MTAGVTVERRVSADEFDEPVVVLRLERSQRAEGPARVRVADQVPGLDPASVAFPERVAGEADWRVDDGRPTATLVLGPGETAITGYAVAGGDPGRLQQGTATVATAGDDGAAGQDGDSGRSLGRALAAALVVLALAAGTVVGGSLVLGGDGPPIAGVTGGGGGNPSITPAPTAEPATTGSDTTAATTTTTAADADGDGLPDARERELGTDPEVTDTDGDGLDDRRETLIGTDPTVADTDDDGLADARELELNTDPDRGDTDGDGLGDAREVDMGLDPTLADTDEDGLDDPRELELDTDPADADTDGDGLPDGAEMNSDLLPGADPLQYDVYVEMDYTDDMRLPDDQRRAILDHFDSAPVENPDGTRGIDLHLIRDDTLPGSGVLDQATLDRYLAEYRDRSCVGYYYAVLAPGTTVADAENRHITRGVAGVGAGVFVSNGDGYVFMHELGHALGLGHGPDGASYQEYPSMMNYDVPEQSMRYYGFTDGDWERVAAGDAPVTEAFRDPFVDAEDRCP